MKIPVNQMRIEAEQIKTRQKTRKAAGVPKNVTPEMLYEMLFDILENQARIENKLNRLEEKSRA